MGTPYCSMCNCRHGAAAIIIIDQENVGCTSTHDARGGGVRVFGPLEGTGNDVYSVQWCVQCGWWWWCCVVCFNVFLARLLEVRGVRALAPRAKKSPGASDQDPVAAPLPTPQE